MEQPFLITCMSSKSATAESRDSVSSSENCICDGKTNEFGTERIVFDENMKNCVFEQLKWRKLFAMKFENIISTLLKKRHHPLTGPDRTL